MATGVEGNSNFSRIRKMIGWNLKNFESGRGNANYIVFRRLNESYALKFGDGSSYDEMLPSFRGNRLTQLIEMRIQQHQEESIKIGQPYRPVVIIDVGYGNGSALLDMADRWGDKVMLIGYGDSTLTKKDITYEAYGLHFQATEPALAAHKIRLIDGELTQIPQRLREAYPNGLQADFITACMVMHSVRLSYPVEKAIQKLYRQLALGGILLCNSTNLKKENLSVLPEGSFELTGKDGNLALVRSESNFPNPQKIRNN